MNYYQRKNLHLNQGRKLSQNQKQLTEQMIQGLQILIKFQERVFMMVIKCQKLKNMFHI